MNLQERILLLTELGEYLQSNDPSWQDAIAAANRQNGWFTEEFIRLATSNIATAFLDPATIRHFADNYQLEEQLQKPLTIGITMAGNIPLVGFHDWFCVLLSGHKALVKLSSKDAVLLPHLIDYLAVKHPAIRQQTVFAEMLKGADAYIATGSNHSARYFDYYFSKYPHIIRKNRSSVAVLDGTESKAELEALADDIHLYFGLGCRNVTKLYVPKGYDFVPLLRTSEKYGSFIEHHKYKNNYDYQLAILLLNNQYYMTNGELLLVENPAIFSAISRLNYEYYEGNPAEILSALHTNPEVQCVIGHGQVPFGKAQCPSISDYADGVDTLLFLKQLTASS
jgi:hypothetical protein